MPQNDPLAAFIDGAVERHSNRPIPLIATRIDVRIRGGLALVSTERLFRNDEAESIEATITFPVPVQATLTGLKARIGDRLLTAVAQAKIAARATYEAAIDGGKTAILHEEALRGVHILSVGHIPPGVEIAVTSLWAAPLGLLGDTPGLRIPTTVGDIYGRSPLSDSDDLIAGPVRHNATLTVTADSGIPLLAGRTVGDAVAVRLNAPIDITLRDWQPRELAGVAADGRKVTLSIRPAPVGEAAIDAELLADNSGSMSERADAGADVTKHQAMLRGLGAADAFLRPEDRIRLWAFASRPRMIGAVAGAGLSRLLRQFPEPGESTEIGAALRAAIAAGDAGDILLLTDGKSYALDVQAIARSGRRFTVVLVGADSLEANVGHLAALTGGQLFVAAGADAGTALQAALRSTRTRHLAAKPIDGPLDTVSALRGGMMVEARWTDEPAPEGDEARAIGAAAFALALPLLDEARAAELAAAHGIVCHLTSLILVDEAGEAQQGLPAMRKIPLEAPANMLMAAAVPPAAMPRAAGSPAPAAAMPHAAGMFSRLRKLVAPKASPPAPFGLAWTLEHIDWAGAPEQLRRGELDRLAPAVAEAILAAAKDSGIGALARILGVPPAVIVLALLARSRGNRAALRFFRAVLGTADPQLLDAAARSLGL